MSDQTGQAVIRAAIRHEKGTLPHCVHLTRKCAEKYGQDLIKRYAGEKAKKFIQDPGLELRTVMELALGNHAVRVRPPWWLWVPDAAQHSEDPPATFPRVKGIGSYEAFYEHCQRLRDDIGCYTVAMLYGSHFEKAQSARGFENFMADLAGAPEYSKALLRNIIDKNCAMIEPLVSCDALDACLLGSDWGSQRGLLMSRATWREMIMPGEQREFDLIHDAGKDVWIHSCGDIRGILPDLRAMNVAVLNPIQPECMDIAELKAQYGGDFTLWGGISTQQTLPYGTPQQVRAETRAVIELLGRDGGYIASPAQELQDDVPYDNITALMDTILEYA